MPYLAAILELIVGVLDQPGWYATFVASCLQRADGALIRQWALSALVKAKT